MVERLLFVMKEADENVGVVKEIMYLSGQPAVR